LPDSSLFHKKFTLDSLKDLGKNLSFYNIPVLIEEKEW
jgi:deoxyribodipyrimidine photolyase